MCGRYSITMTAEEIAEIFDLPQPGFSTEPRYNVAPTQTVPIVIDDHVPRLMLARWGLVPSWSKDMSIGSKLINARAETLGEKKSFREAFHKRRCLVPADGFYEWQRQGQKKQPYRIALPKGQLFALAGLWETWKPAQGPSLDTFTIITTEASEAVRGLHHRMPVILATRGEQQEWLAAGNGEADALLASYKGTLNIYEVSTAVNSPLTDAPECIEPLLRIFPN